jgi:GNAT superfamily N-acetyltransferase
MPQADDVHHYFDELLSESREDIALLVAEVSGTVVGMTEVDLEPTPPEHQILSSLRQAQVHTVVLEGQRGQGVGKALFAAAERYAAQHGVARLIAPILAGNSQAVGFYSQAGFRDHGIILRKELPVNPALTLLFLSSPFRETGGNFGAVRGA